MVLREGGPNLGLTAVGGPVEGSITVVVNSIAVAAATNQQRHVFNLVEVGRLHKGGDLRAERAGELARAHTTQGGGE